jgi:hypothetical protein
MADRALLLQASGYAIMMRCVAAVEGISKIGQF